MLAPQTIFAPHTMFWPSRMPTVFAPQTIFAPHTMLWTKAGGVKPNTPPESTSAPQAMFWVQGSVSLAIRVNGETGRFNHGVSTSAPASTARASAMAPAALSPPAPCVRASDPSDNPSAIIFYFGEPTFQDGIIAQAVDAVVASGVSYFSAAGNAGRNSWENLGLGPGNFTRPPGSRLGDLPGTLGPGLELDFDPGSNRDTTLSFNVGADATAFGVLAWGDPSSSAGGLGANTDLDLTLVDIDGNVIHLIKNPNIGGDPFETFLILANPLPTTVQVAVNIAEGPPPPAVKLILYDGPDSTFIEHQTFSSTITGHANTDGAIAVGAANYSDTPFFSTSPPEITDYSSAGGTPIRFDPLGIPLSTPEFPVKPEITAPDGTNNTFFGLDSEPDGFPNFFGTSASAPHAAAVATLLKQAHPFLTPAEIEEKMGNTAIDMNDPHTAVFDQGYDTGTGFGLIDALNAGLAPPDPLLGNPDDIVINDYDGGSFVVIGGVFFGAGCQAPGPPGVYRPFDPVVPRPVPPFSNRAPVANPSPVCRASSINPFVTVSGTASALPRRADGSAASVVSVTWVNDRGGSGTADGTTNWSIQHIPVQAGTNRIVITVTDSDGRTGIGFVNVRVDTLLYFLAEGATGPFFDYDLLLGNPHLVPASITITFLKEDGSTIVQNETLAPTSQRTIRVNDIAGIGSVAVTWIPNDRPTSAGSAPAKRVTREVAPTGRPGRLGRRPQADR